MERGEERREHIRLRQKGRVYVTVLSAPDHSELENETLSCSSEDVSASGVRLAVPSSFPVGSLMEMRVVTRDPIKVYWHIGRVVWCKKRQDGTYRAGVRFTKTPEDTLKAWEKALAAKLARVKQTASADKA